MDFSQIILQRDNADYTADTIESYTKISIDNSLPSMLGPMWFLIIKIHVACHCITITDVFTQCWQVFYHKHFVRGLLWVWLKDGLTGITGRSWNFLTQYIQKMGLFSFPKEVQLLTEFICICGPSWVVFLSSWSLHHLSPGFGGVCTTIPQHHTPCQRQRIRSGWPM